MTARTPVAPGYGAGPAASHSVPPVAGSFARMPLTGPLRTRWLDPALVGLVALAVYGVHGFDADLGRDQGTFVYGGQQLAHGVPPYVGIFNSVGPVVDVVTGAGIRVGSALGLDDVRATRVTYLLVSVLAVVALSVLARDALRSRAAGLVVPALFSTFAGFLSLASDGPREKTVMVLFLELALLLMLRRRWFWAGILSAAAILTWQPVVLTAVAAAISAILTSNGRRPRAAAAYVAGALLPTALVTLLYLVSGHLTLAWWGFVLINIGYTTQPNIVQSWDLLTAGYGASLVLVVVGWLLSVALGVGALTRRRRTRSAHDAEIARALLVLGTGGLVAGLWSCFAVNGAPDLFVLLPFAALGAGAALILVVRTLPIATVRRVIAAVALLAVAAAGAESVTTRSSDLVAERQTVTRVAAALPAGSTILSVNSPEVLALLERRNPYRYQLSTSATAPFMDDHLEGGLAAYADRIARLRPALIAVGHLSVDDWLRPVLRADYVRVGPGDHWVWYASTDLDPDVRRRLRQAAAGR
jgi:hypothetical protein